MKNSDPVLFNSHRKGEYRDFSNFSERGPFRVGRTKVVWRSVEHYFAAHKTKNLSQRRKIRKAQTPLDAKRMGSAVALRKDWDRIKYDYMLTAVRAKFQQNPELAALLLATGDRPIHEDRPDPWWGGGPNFPKGRDWLGQILMSVRSELQAEIRR